MSSTVRAGDVVGRSRSRRGRSRRSAAGTCPQNPRQPVPSYRGESLTTCPGVADEAPVPVLSMVVGAPHAVPGAGQPGRDGADVGAGWSGEPGCLLEATQIRRLRLTTRTG